MVTISKNGKTKTVSEPIYNSVFRDNGWEIVGEKSSTSPVKEEKKVVPQKVEVVKEEVVETEVNEPEEEIPDEVWDEVEAEEDVEKPISEMNHDELVVKAKELKIDVKGLNNKQLREAIKAKM